MSLFRMTFIRVSLLAAASLFVGSHASADPLPSRPKLTVNVNAPTARACGGPFIVNLQVQASLAKLDGRLELRGVSTPITAPKDGTVLATAQGGTLDCGKGLHGTLTIENGAQATAKDGPPLFVQTWEAKAVTFSVPTKGTVSPYGGFVSLSVPSTTCGDTIKAQVVNKLTGKGGTDGPPVKLIVTGNGVTRTASFAPGATDVELGVLDCAKGAPTYTLGGQDVTGITITPKTVSY